MDYKDTKLLVFLSTFSKEELSEFEKFLESPYFKKGRDPLPLFKALKKFHPFESDKFNEESVFKEIYPGQNFEDKNSKNTLRSLSSYLLKSVEDFLYISRLRDNKVLRNRTLLTEILERNLTKQFEQYMKSAIEEQESEEIISGVNNLEKYHLEGINARYYSTILDMEKYFAHISKSVEHISSHFWIDFINTAKSVLIAKNNFHLSEGKEFIDKILDATNMENILTIHEGSPNHAHISFHYQIYRHLESHGKEDNYETAKQIFFQSKAGMGRHDKVYHYSDLINIFQMRMTKEGLDSKRELFNLINACLEDKAYKLSDDDFMHPLFYRNAILCADYLKETEWAYSFIDNYSSELKPELRENLQLYSRALIDYAAGNFEDSLLNISRVKYNLVEFKTDIKILMMRIFYELELLDQADSTIDSLRHLVRSTENLDNDYKKAFSNYIKFYTRLLKLKIDEPKNRSEELNFISEEIRQEKILLQRIWLNEKLEEMASGEN